MSLVSVIMPTYNRSKPLCKAIESVLEQTYTDYEIVVVDDCSTDDTESVVKNINDKRIHYIKLGKNTGGSMKPRQVGISSYDSKYIAILDDDDFWVDKAKLELQVLYLETHPECVLVGTDSITIKDGIKQIHHHYPKTYLEIRRNILSGNCFYHSSVLYRRDVYNKVGGYQVIKGGRYENFSNDYGLWLQMGMVGEIINLPIYGVGHIYCPNLNSTNRMFYMMKQMKLIGEYKNYYPNYYIANMLRLIYSIAELPLLRNIKNGSYRD